MNFEFKLPDIGEGLVEGEIVKWFVKEGQTVEEHQPIASILTDKAEVEVPSPKTGKVLKLFGKVGQKIKVHSPLVTLDIASDGKSAKSGAPVASQPETPAPSKPVKQSSSKPSSVATAEKPVSAPPAGSYVFNLPDLGEGLVEGELVKWHVKAGDSVTEHQPIAAVLTDKAEVEVPSPKTGKVLTLHGKPGQKVKVHAPFVTFSVSGGASAPAAAKAPAVQDTPTVASPAALMAPSPARPAKRETDVLATPMVRKLAKDKGIDITLINGTGPEGRVLENDVKNFKGGTSGQLGTSTNVNATPAVQALAASLGVNLAAIRGTGPGGRISENDVRAVAPAAPKGAPKAAAPLSFTPAGTAATGEEILPFVGIRRKIAEKMAQSKRTVADVTHVDECDMTALLALRDELKPIAAGKGVKLTFLPFIVKALTKTLGEFPMFNSSLNEAEGQIVIKRTMNIGIAVAAPQGLVVPNIKGADGKDLFGLAAEIAGLAEKVRTNKIEVAALQGGTFTITNIGPIGGLYANPIVNHPEVAILGLMKLQKRPMYRDGGIFVRDMMNLCLSFDHRVVDGADAAKFMNTLIRHLENPRTLL